MDRRCSDRLVKENKLFGSRLGKVLLLFFLLAVFMSAGLVFWNQSRMQEALKEDQASTLGTLTAGDNLTEAQIIRSFTKPVDGDALTEGRKVEQKYGFSDKNTRQEDIIRRFFQQEQLILAGCLVCLCFPLAGIFMKHRQAEAIFIQHRNEYLEEKARYQLFLDQKATEEGHMKSNLTDVVHQLKTPVASLKMSMDIAFSEGYSPEEHKEFKEQSKIQIQKLNLMLDGLVKISQLETDLIQLNPQPYSVKKLINEAVNSVILKALENKLELEVDLEKDFELLIDHKWTVEALGNVLENAVKYSPEETTIRLKAAALVNYGLIEIIDEGPGIPVTEVNLIYQRFYRGKNAENIEGSGVGLYLTRQIVEGQGGAVLVKASQPTGSKFQITLPLVQ